MPLAKNKETVSYALNKNTHTKVKKYCKRYRVPIGEFADEALNEMLTKLDKNYNRKDRNENVYRRNRSK